MLARRSTAPVVPLAAAVIVAAAATGASPIAGVALLGLVVAAGLLLFPVALLPAILVTSALNRVGVQYGDAQIRIDLITVVLAATVLINAVAVRTIRVRDLVSPILVPLIAYALCNVVSTVLVGSEKVRGLKLDAQILAVVLAVAVVAGLLRDRGNARRLLPILWWVTVGEAAISLVLLALYIAGVSVTGVQLGDFGLPMAYGTGYEANIFGSFLLGNFFLLLADYAINGRSARYAGGLVVVLLAIAASETRTVWIGLLFGLGVFALLLQQHRGSGGRLMPVVAGIPLVALAAGILGTATPLASRILAVFNLQSSSASGRLVIFQAAISDWRAHPLLGLGTGSFNFGGGVGQAHPWLPNLFLLTLHDTGLLGILALGWLIFAFYRASLRGLRVGGAATTIAMGAVPGFTALLIAFQTTSGFWFAYPWIVATAGAVSSRLSTPAEACA
ncbi:MAG: O-antigen ligase family protein [Chloroflexota bacterium]|nr:MAG: hypothetical protein DLM70_05120 [Chloroflexota bacterium]